MDILVALISAFIGAITTFTLTTLYKNRENRKKVLNAVRSELKLNIELARDISEKNNVKKIKGGGKCVIIPFAEGALQGVISSGELSQINRKMVEPLIKAYAMIKRVNFVAEKIKHGTYRKSVGIEYTLRVYEANKNLTQVLSQFKSEIKRSKKK
jgi:hypothetical protein